MFCSYLVLINHSWGKSKALRKMVHHFFCTQLTVFPWFTNTRVSVNTQGTQPTLCGVSLSTMTAISVDRLLALLLGLRYTHTVTLKRTYLIVAIFWVFSSFSGLLYFFNYRIILWLGRIGISLYLLTSIILYTKIFCTLRHHRAEGCGCFVLTSFWSN